MTNEEFKTWVALARQYQNEVSRRTGISKNKLRAWAQDKEIPPIDLAQKLRAAGFMVDMPVIQAHMIESDAVHNMAEVREHGKIVREYVQMVRAGYTHAHILHRWRAEERMPAMHIVQHCETHPIHRNPRHRGPNAF